ncbi:hypothetical protein ACIQJT_04375 [Streptomyces sp. NPDC091972]|uniref:hypothetical protein n=1 Tax=Streptomyces sp. NPDC091972 TaxID=3366007 RepID=UPI00380A6688
MLGGLADPRQHGFVVNGLLHELRKRKIIGPDYTGTKLRENLGLEPPARDTAPAGSDPSHARDRQGPGAARSYAVSQPTTAVSSLVDTDWTTCLHRVMSPQEPLTRRRAVDLVRVAAALCRFPD